MTDATEIEILLLIIGIAAGFFMGYFFARYRASQAPPPAPSQDAAQSAAMIGGLTAQIAEMRGKFTEIEKSREMLENERRRADLDKEKRISDFIEQTNRFIGQTNKLFVEQADRHVQSDAEKEKRIKELAEQIKLFFDGEKKNTEKFLTEQGRSREEIEKKRDAQITDMNNMIVSFTRAVSGTKKRGIVGEDVLKEALTHSIKAGVIVCDLKTDNGQVEFAWNLEDGKYIPIDSKLPDVFQLLDDYNAAADTAMQKAYKKDIVDKVKKEIKRIQKYQNLSNTTGNCLLVVPEGVLEIAPELVGVGRQEQVFVCSYKDVFPIAHLLNDQYIRLKEEGDVGRYKQVIDALFQILEKINKKTKTIDDAITQMKNANEEIKDEVIKGKRQQ